MASKEVLDQIRDLQSFIDGFAAEGTPTSIENEKTEIEPMILQKPDEKTLMEPTHNQQQQDKTLVEQPNASTKTEREPLSILSYDLNLSDDFSSLVDQFKDLEVSCMKTEKLQRQNVSKDSCLKMEGEKVQLETVITSVAAKESPLSATPTTAKRSRRTSVSSKRSQKSSKSCKSSRRLKQQQLPSAAAAAAPPLPLPQQQKYIARSFDEMMRIPDIYERLSFYEKTLDLCLKAESPITFWCQSNKQKGKPEPLLEGYVPQARRLSPELPHNNDFGSISSTFSGSISMFLKKATISTPSVSKRHLAMDNNNGYRTPYNQSSNSSSIFGRSISRLNLPRPTHQAPHTMSTPLLHRFHSKNKIGSSKKPSLQQQHGVLTPNTENYTSSSSTYTANPRSFGSTCTINSRGESTKISPELAYMMNVLPQIDMRILESALNEAKGDPMAAISIAVSTSKRRFHESNSPAVAAFKSATSRSSTRRYGT